MTSKTANGSIKPSAYPGFTSTAQSRLAGDNPVYYNSSIVFVNQIDIVGGKTIYIVEIQDEKSIRKLRVDDDDMEIVQEFEK